MGKRICLNRSVLDFMDSVLDKDSFVLEIGSGWSSRWFADRCGLLISIETDPYWAQLVRNDLNGSRCIWFVHTIDELTDAMDRVDHVDLVLVDGVEVQRNICTQLSWPLIRSGGWLVLDDAQREVHSGAIKFMTQFGEGRSLKWQEGDLESAKDRVAIAWQKP